MHLESEFEFLKSILSKRRQAYMYDNNNNKKIIILGMLFSHYCETNTFVINIVTFVVFIRF